MGRALRAISKLHTAPCGPRGARDDRRSPSFLSQAPRSGAKALDSFSRGTERFAVDLDQSHVHRHRQAQRLLARDACRGTFDHFARADDLDARASRTPQAHQREPNVFYGLERHETLETKPATAAAQTDFARPAEEGDLRADQ